LGGFAYGLFIAPSTVTSLSPLDLLTPPWTFAGVYATNAPGAGRLYGGTGIPVPGWVATTNSYVVAGWSANIAWTDWNSVASQLNGASFGNGVWVGSDWLASSQGGFFGVSGVAYGQDTDPSSGRPPLVLFGSYATDQGVPIPTGFDLFVVNTPEPSAFVLGLAGCLLFLGRRAAWRRPTRRRRPSDPPGISSPRL
jgi:hypothetical protein